MTTLLTPQRRVTLLFVVVAVLLLGIPALATAVTDWLWFREIGFERVFTLKITAQLLLGSVALLLGLTVLYGSARIALRGLERSAESILVLAEGGVQMRTKFLVRVAQAFALPATLLLSFLLASGLASSWRTLIQFWSRTPFGDTDPIFGRDIAYYVFTLPALQVALDWVWGLLFISLLLVAIPIYVVRGDISIKTGRLRIEQQAEWHLALLASLWLVLSAVRLWLIRMPNVLFGTHAPLQGASWTDLHVRLPGMQVMSLLFLIGAVAMLVGARRGQLARFTVIVVAANFLLGALVNGVIPTAVQRLVVQPNELAKESPQIVHHIAATRRAWSLDNVERRELEGSQQ